MEMIVVLNQATLTRLSAALAALAIAAAVALAAPAAAHADDPLAAGGSGALQAQDAKTAAASTSGDVPMYRMYNPNSGEHFYTASKVERKNLVDLAWHYEGLGWMAPASGDPVYRMYNPNEGDHHYTPSAAERDWLVSLGWNYEGVGWKSCAASDKARAPLYRQFNPNATQGTHNYTLSKAENDNVVAAGWRAEGVGWYGHAVPADFKDDMQAWYPHISGDFALDTRLDLILHDHKSLWSCYNYVSSLPYRAQNEFWSDPHYLPNNLTIPYAREMATVGSGNCYRSASLMCWLARGLGYDAQVVSGWVPSHSGGRAPHGWVEVKSNGKVYVIDADMNHAVPYKDWFMVTYEAAPVAYGSW